jgi:hypothetical protein
MTAAPRDRIGSSERRAHHRRSLRMNALVLLPDDDLLAGHTVDLSLGGACLSVPKQLSIGDECRLQLEFEACGIRRNVLLVSQVCYCREGVEGYRVGLQFVQLAPDTAGFLASMLEAL